MHTYTVTTDVTPLHSLQRFAVTVTHPHEMILAPGARQSIAAGALARELGFVYNDLLRAFDSELIHVNSATARGVLVEYSFSAHNRVDLFLTHQDGSVHVNLHGLLATGAPRGRRLPARGASL